MQGTSIAWTVVGVVVVVLIILFASWAWQDRTVTLYNGFWQYGLLTTPGVGCTGTAKSCDADANLQSYAQFYYTALAVGNIDPNYNDSNQTGSQQALTVGKSAPVFLIAPLDQQGNSSFYQWKFKNSYWNSVGVTLRFAQPSYELYNVGLGQYLVPVAGDFPQGTVKGWGPAYGNTSVSPPGWLAHTFSTSAGKYDYKTVFPYTWRMGAYFVPNSAGAPEGTDPMNGKPVPGVNVIVCSVWFPKTAGAKSGDGAWFDYYMEVGAGTDGSTYQLGGPVNLNLSTTANARMNTRFEMGYYFNENGPVNATSYIKTLAGGASPVSTPGKQNTTCNNGSPSGSSCKCTGGAIGWNCIYPTPSASDVTSFKPGHKYSSSSATASRAPVRRNQSSTMSSMSGYDLMPMVDSY